MNIFLTLQLQSITKRAGGHLEQSIEVGMRGMEEKKIELVLIFFCLKLKRIETQIHITVCKAVALH